MSNNHEIMYFCIDCIVTKRSPGSIICCIFTFFFAERVEAEAEAEAMLFEMVEAEAEAVNSQICLLEAEAEAVKKSTASASLVKTNPNAEDGVK